MTTKKRTRAAVENEEIENREIAAAAAAAAAVGEVVAAAAAGVDETTSIAKNSKSEQNDQNGQNEESTTKLRRRNRKSLVVSKSRISAAEAWERKYGGGGGGAVSSKRRKLNKPEKSKKSEKIQDGQESEEEEDGRVWRGWKEVFFVGTEWRNYDMIYDVQWDFNHLEQRLRDPRTGFGTDAKSVYLFGVTEPQMIPPLGGQMYFVPAIIAVVGDVPAPSKMGIKSVQMETEEMVDLEELKMTWTPLSLAAGGQQQLQPERAGTVGGGGGGGAVCYMLHCNVRRAALGRMKEEAVRRYEYCLPYFFRPSKFLDDSNYTTEVTGICTVEGRGVSYEFDWDMDDLDDTVEELCAANEVTQEEHKNTVREAIREAVRTAKRHIKEDKDKKRAELDKIPEDVQKAMNEARFIKFYPRNKRPDLEAHNLKSRFINRYYGHAFEVV